MAGAFVGAGSAFLLESANRRSQEKQRHIESTNVALHVLIEYYSELDNYKRQVIQPMLERRENIVPPTNPNSIPRQPIDFNSLSFIAASKDSDVVHELVIAVRKFEQVMQSIQHFSHIHIYELQPKMDKLKIVAGTSASREEAEAVAGRDVFARLESLNTYILENVDDTMSSLKTAMERLRGAARNRYKKASFVSLSTKDGQVDRL
jgi:hypothetical protein